MNIGVSLASGCGAAALSALTADETKDMNSKVDNSLFAGIFSELLDAISQKVCLGKETASDLTIDSLRDLVLKGFSGIKHGNGVLPDSKQVDDRLDIERFLKSVEGDETNKVYAQMDSILLLLLSVDGNVRKNILEFLSGVASQDENMLGKHNVGLKMLSQLEKAIDSKISQLRDNKTVVNSPSEVVGEGADDIPKNEQYTLLNSLRSIRDLIHSIKDSAGNIGLYRDGDKKSDLLQSVDVGSDLFVAKDENQASHIIWKNNKQSQHSVREDSFFNSGTNNDAKGDSNLVRVAMLSSNKSGFYREGKLSKFRDTQDGMLGPLRDYGDKGFQGILLNVHYNSLGHDLDGNMNYSGIEKNVDGSKIFGMRMDFQADNLSIVNADVQEIGFVNRIEHGSQGDEITGGLNNVRASMIFQIGDKVKQMVVMRKIPGGIRMRLFPPELGQIRIDLRYENNGLLKVQLIPEKAEAHHILRDTMMHLRDHLLESLKISDVKIELMSVTNVEDSLGPSSYGYGDRGGWNSSFWKGYNFEEKRKAKDKDFGMVFASFLDKVV